MTEQFQGSSSTATGSSAGARAAATPRAADAPRSCCRPAACPRPPSTSPRQCPRPRCTLDQTPLRAGVSAHALATRAGVLQGSHPAELGAAWLEIRGRGGHAHRTHPHPLFPFRGAPLTPANVQVKGKGWPPALCPAWGPPPPPQGLGTYRSRSQSSPLGWVQALAKRDARASSPLPPIFSPRFGWLSAEGAAQSRAQQPCMPRPAGGHGPARPQPTAPEPARGFLGQPDPRAKAPASLSCLPGLDLTQRASRACDRLLTPRTEDRPKMDLGWGFRQSCATRTHSHPRIQEAQIHTAPGSGLEASCPTGNVPVPPVPPPLSLGPLPAGRTRDWSRRWCTCG